jgi:hypothetical protein
VRLAFGTTVNAAAVLSERQDERGESASRRMTRVSDGWNDRSQYRSPDRRTIGTSPERNTRNACPAADERPRRRPDWGWASDLPRLADEGRPVSGCAR